MKARDGAAWLRWSPEVRRRVDDEAGNSIRANLVDKPADGHEPGQEPGQERGTGVAGFAEPLDGGHGTAPATDAPRRPLVGLTPADERRIGGPERCRPRCDPAIARHRALWYATLRPDYKSVILAVNHRASIARACLAAIHRY